MPCDVLRVQLLEPKVLTLVVLLILVRLSKGALVPRLLRRCCACSRFVDLLQTRVVPLTASWRPFHLI
jgi:hypothetical protein